MINDYEKKLNHMRELHHESLLKSGSRKCKKCEETLPSRKEFLEHKKLLHQEERNKRDCKSCDYVSQSIGNLRLHMLLKHMKSLFACNICNLGFNTNSKLKSHLEIMHKLSEPKKMVEAMVFTCRKCNLSFDSDDFKKHAEKVHQVPGLTKGQGRSKNKRVKKETNNKISQSWQCNFCAYSSDHKHQVMTHIDLIHMRTSHICRKCGFQTKYRYEIVSHLKLEHNLNSSKEIIMNLLYECVECSFKSGWELFFEHVNAHAQNSNDTELKERATFYCEQCKVIKSNKMDIISHIPF